MNETLVVYDSYFGNTEEIANAIAAGMDSPNTVEVINVKNANPEGLNRFKLLIVGSPTRKFSPSPAIKKFLKQIPKKSLQAVKVACFDTRVTEDEVKKIKILAFFVKIFGYAAKTISDKLEINGGELIVPPEGFYVTGMEGPLLEGESERATEWAKKITSLVN